MRSALKRSTLKRSTLVRSTLMRSTLAVAEHDDEDGRRPLAGKDPTRRGGDRPDTVADPAAGTHTATDADLDTDSDTDLGGDPVCWLPRVCPECGALADTDPPTICPRCHGAIPGG